MQVLEVDKIGSAVSPLNLTKTVAAIDTCGAPKVGDVVVVRALSESVTYGNLELPSGRLAKINAGDVLLGVLGKRRALKGFVGDVPASLKKGDRLHLLNMGGLIGICKGHHSSLSDAIQVEVIGAACDEDENVLNIADRALKPTNLLETCAPVVVVAGTCMNSGKTVAATEIIKQAHHAGLKVAGAKLSGVACLRDTLNMEDHGAISTASFLDCGMPSTVDAGNLAPMAKAVLNKLNESEPDLIVVELGDGIVGGYAVDSILQDAQIRAATSAFVFCASDYVGVIGGVEVLRRLGIEIDVVAGSVTDSQMGEDFVENTLNLAAGNARRDGLRLFRLIKDKTKKSEYCVAF
jgi:dethiobiotin synthetase